MNLFRRTLAISLCWAMLAGVACDGDDKKGDAAKVSKAPVSKADITMGAIFDLSGATADPGTPYSQGVRDYIEYRNTEGGVEGHRLSLLWQDFGYKVPSAEQLYQDYVSRGAKVFLGWAGDDTDALRPRIKQDRIPFMSAAYAETLADPTVSPYNFLPGATYSQQMRIALKYIANQNKGKRAEVAVFHHDSSFGASPLEDGRRFIADKKLDIGYKTYAMPAHATDYIAQIGQARAQGAKYIIIQNVSPFAATLAKNLAAQNSTAQVICLNWCADELFVKLAGPAAEMMIGVMPFSPPVAGVQGLSVIDNFLKTKGTDSGAKGVRYIQGWYTAAVMVEGIANAVKANGDTITGDSIRAGLERIAGFKTDVSAPITFTAEDHTGLKSAPLFQVQSGVFKKIADPIDPAS